MPPAAHSRLGASKAHRWMHCPGSPREEAKYKDTVNKWAEEGTAAHMLAERCLKNNTDTYLYEGETITTPHGTEVKVDETMVEKIQEYIEAIRDDAEKLFGHHMHVETQFHLATIHDDLWGTNDCMLVQAFGELIVYDLKYGFVTVEVEDNPQLKIYARGGMECREVERITIVIHQPRAFHAHGSDRRQTFTAEELIEWGDTELKAAADATDDPDAPLCAGEWCKYCLAETDCLTKRAAMEAAVGFDVVDLSQGEVTVVKKTLPDVDAMTPEQVGDICLNVALVEDWIKAMKGRLDRLVREGVEGTGHKLVQGRATRYWEDEEALREFTASSEINIYNKKLKSPAQLEKHIKELGGDKKTIQHLIAKKHGDKVVPNSAKGEPLTIEPVNFDPVESKG